MERNPSRRGARTQTKDGGWYVFTDTHLGLAPNRDDIKLSGECCDPERVGQFVNWLGDLGDSTKVKPNDPKYNIRVWERDDPVHLKKPQKLIMLGDMQDIWDSTDREVEFCSRPVFNLIERINCEKIYITGNHDYEMHTLIGKQLSGKNPLTITEKPYCFKKGKKSRENGKKGYLFIHGMEFAPDFRGHSLWKHLGSMRSGSLAFSTYGNFFVAALVLGLLLQFLPSSSFIGGILSLFLATTLFESFCRWYVVFTEAITLYGAVAIFRVLLVTSSDPYMVAVFLFGRVLVLMTLILFLVGLFQPLLPEVGVAITPLVLWMTVSAYVYNSGIWYYLFLIVVPLVFLLWTLKNALPPRRYRMVWVTVSASLCFFPLMLLLAGGLGVEFAFLESLLLVVFLGSVMWAISGPTGVITTSNLKWIVLLVLLLAVAIGIPVSISVLGWWSLPSLESLLSSLSFAAGVLFGPPLVLVWLALGFPRLFYKCGVHLWRILSKVRIRREVPSKEAHDYVRQLNKDSKQAVEYKDVVMVAGDAEKEEKKNGLFDDLGSLVLVYGHTHFMSQFSTQLLVKANQVRSSPSGAKGNSERKVDINCFNVPSWTKDLSKGGMSAQQLRNAFLYIDSDREETSPLFLGWDWENQRPFHVPWDIVQLRDRLEKLGGEFGSLPTAYAPRLLSIGWPYKMVAEWVGWRRCIAKHPLWRRVFKHDEEITKEVLFEGKTPKNGEELVMTPCCHKLIHKKHLGDHKVKKCPICGEPLPTKIAMTAKRSGDWRRVIETWKHHNDHYTPKMKTKNILKKLQW